MKKNIYKLFIIAFTAVFLVACGAKTKDSGDSSLSKVEDKKVLTVATSGTLFPSSYYNDKNELVGYDVDIVKEVAKRLNLKIEFKEYNVDGQIASLDKGETDFAANDFGLTAEDRKKKFSLSTPIKYSFTSLIVRKSDDSGIHSLDDLKGKKAAGEPNTSYMKFAEKMGAIPVTYDNATNDQYLTDVANGRTDVIINDYYLQKMSVGALPNIPVKILDGIYFDPSESGFLFKKESDKLREKVDSTLEDMKKDGTLAKISNTYFGEDVSVKSDKKIETVDSK
ncbi:transporter substrate-binding domain-containing protein [Floricoccus penangensis]|uniref:transporter substrate-binding domain-containing protein n=1 Tax=Floricoccus penangensis TaxID=1859475 RepID=UPI002041C217|nr:transporter substrate-binding domain-containing protein [Floricoccus penangensis]URZ87162.1 transporter substrate-binding domain-containing protein [Floricoccus penangensis]